MIKRKELPINESPLIAYMEEAYPLSVALTDPSRWEWVYSNYIQLIYQNPDLFEEQPLKFYKLSLNSGFVWDADCPVLIYDRISRDMISFFDSDIIRLICFAIDNEKYPILYLDEYYLSYRDQYRRVHYIHENLFFGYDEEKEILKGLAYVSDEEGYSFKTFCVPFSEVREAYEDLNYNGEMRNKVILLSHERERLYGFNMQAVIVGLREYINAYPSEKRYAELSTTNLGEDYKYGIGIYEPFIEYIQRRKNASSIIPFQLLVEHKSLMCSRYRYMVENRYICPDEEVESALKKLERDALILKMLYLKYQANGDERMLEKVVDRIRSLKFNEQEVLQNFLQMVEKGCAKEAIVYSKNGRWNEVEYALGTVENENIRVCFRLHIISEKTMGYMVFSTHEKMKEYCDVAKIVIEAPNHRFMLDGHDGQIEVPDIDCNVGEYSIVVDINNTKGIYSCEILSDSGERGFLIRKIKKESAHSFPIDRVAIIHDYSYRYGVSDFRIEEGINSYSVVSN